MTLWAHHFFLPKIRFALESILDLAPGLNLPFLTIWVARAFAFAAWLLSGIGYLRSPGNPNSDFGILFRFRVVNFAIFRIRSLDLILIPLLAF